MLGLQRKAVLVEVLAVPANATGSTSGAAAADSTPSKAAGQGQNRAGEERSPQQSPGKRGAGAGLWDHGQIEALFVQNEQLW